MTQTERRQMIVMLNAMQREFEEVAKEEGGVIMIEVPGMRTKHVFSNQMSAKVARALARVMENERYSIINKHQ